MFKLAVQAGKVRNQEWNVKAEPSSRNSIFFETEHIGKVERGEATHWTVHGPATIVAVRKEVTLTSMLRHRWGRKTAGGFL